MPGERASALKASPTTLGLTSDGADYSSTLDGSLYLSLSHFGNLSEKLIFKNETEGDGGTGQEKCRGKCQD